MKPCLRLMLSCEEYDDGPSIQLLGRIGVLASIVDYGMANISSLSGTGRLYVEGIAPGKAAAICGIRKNDVIEEINGFEICSWTDVEKALYSQTSAKPIRFQVRRSDSTGSLVYMAVWYD